MRINRPAITPIRTVKLLTSAFVCPSFGMGVDRVTLLSAGLWVVVVPLLCPPPVALCVTTISSALGKGAPDVLPPPSVALVTGPTDAVGVTSN